MKKFLRRITGISTPFVGISWSAPPDEQKREPSLPAQDNPRASTHYEGEDVVTAPRLPKQKDWSDEKTLAVTYDIIEDMEQKIRRLIAWYEGREPDTPYEQVGIEEGAVEVLEGLVQDIAHQVLRNQQPSTSLWEPSGIYCARDTVKQPSYNKTQVAYFERFLVWLQKTRAFLGYLEGVIANLKPDNGKANKADAGGGK